MLTAMVNALVAHPAFSQAMLAVQEIEARSILGNIGRGIMIFLLVIFIIGLVIGLVIGFFIGKAAGRASS